MCWPVAAQYYWACMRGFARVWYGAARMMMEVDDGWGRQGAEEYDTMRWHGGEASRKKKQSVCNEDNYVCKRISKENVCLFCTGSSPPRGLRLVDDIMWRTSLDAMDAMDGRLGGEVILVILNAKMRGWLGGLRKGGGLIGDGVCVCGDGDDGDWLVAACGMTEGGIRDVPNIRWDYSTGIWNTDRALG